MMVGDRNIVRAPDADALAEAAAHRLIARIAAQPERAAICLSGGSTPQRLYRLLAAEPYRNQIPWERVHWFIGDDRFVPLDDPLSNMGTACRLFLDRCAPANHIHPMAQDVATPDAAAARYEMALKAFYGAPRIDPGRPLFDLVLMGIGPDGHTASLFPGDAAVDETVRWVVGVGEAAVDPFVPRVTLTLPALAACDEMLFLLSGEDKRAVVERVLADPTLPAARARSSKATTWLVDDAAMPEQARGR